MILRMFLVLILLFNSSDSLSNKLAVTSTELQTDQLNATLYLPQAAGKMPAIVVLGGSSGRRNTVYPEVLAAHGFVVMSLAYFRATGLPDTLDDLPVETVSKALDYLQDQPQVDAKRLAILGVSRGSELAFLSASIDPRITAVAGIVPSSVAWHGQTSPHAWTVQGYSIPALSFSRQSTTPIYQRAETALASKEAQQAQFEFEKINGSILLISAKNDHIWPSEQMANQITTYLKQRDFKFPVQHITVEDDHFIDPATIDGFEQQLVNHFRNFQNKVEPN